MKASTKVTTGIVSIYAIASIVLAGIMYAQARMDIERETYSAMLLAEALSKLQLDFNQLHYLLQLNRHLTTDLVASESDNLFESPEISAKPSLTIVSTDGAQNLMVHPNISAEMEEIEDTVIQVFSVTLISLALTLVALHVSINHRLMALRRLCNAMDLIPKGHFDISIKACGVSEIDQLIQHYSDMSKQLLMQKNKVTRLKTRLASLMEQERRSFARDLHDNLGQVVTAISMHSYLLKQHSGNASFVNRCSDSIVQSCSQLQSGIKALSRQLYPIVLTRAGLIEALHELCKQWDSVEGCHVEINSTGHTLISEIDRDTHIYRIVQEAINNVVKHTESPTALISVYVSQAEMRVEIKDWGKGSMSFSGDGSEGLGLESMKDRASLIGGEIDFLCWEEGIRVVLNVPLKNESEVSSDA